MAVADRITDYAQTAWARLSRSRRKRNCKALARIARSILAAKTQVHKAVGQLFGRAAAAMGAGDPAQAFYKELASNIPIRAVERGLIAVNPAAPVKIKAPKAKPLLWTGPRVQRWRQDGQRPAASMVWTPAQCGQFLDSIEDDRLYPMYHLAAYWGLRRSELVGLEWADLDLTTRRLHVRQAQSADELDSTKSEAGERIIRIDQGTAAVLEAWRERQLFERLEWGEAWTDSGRVFTREDGQPLRPAHVSEHFGVLARRAGLPLVRFHDLRHGAATMLLAAGQPPKVVSETLGHSTTAFTMDVYAVVAEELAEAAAVAIEAFVPRKRRAEVAE